MLTRTLETMALGGRPAGSAEGRERLGVLEGWVSVAVNVVVFLAKIIPGLLIGSASLVADAVHSLGDVATSAVVIWSFRASARPPDQEHPFGHGRIENIASLIIAVLLLVAAVELGRSGVLRLVHPKPVRASWALLAVLVVTIGLKEWLARFAGQLGRRLDSGALKGDAWHHRSDVLATTVVLAALAGERLGGRFLDGAAALIVAGFVAWAGIALVRASMDPLIGEAPPGELRETIRSLALAVNGVQAVHHIMVHAYGRLSVISLHVEIPAAWDVLRAHRVTEEVEARVSEALGAVVVVHMDPVDRAHPLYRAMAAHLDEIRGGMEGFRQYHDLRISGTPEQCTVAFDAVLDGRDRADLEAAIREAVRGRFPQVGEVLIKVETTLAY